MNAYILGTSTVKPQFAAAYNDLSQQQALPEASLLTEALDPAASCYQLSSGDARRLSRFVRMGVVASMDCLQKSGVATPDGIAVGTGLGGEESAEKFLHSFIHHETQTLSPTPFFQSLPNNVSGQIALMLRNYSYNMTYSHRGFSFESALLDGLLLLSEMPQEAAILVGGLDEAAPYYHKALAAEGVAKRHYERVENSQLPGFVLSGGASFMVLSSTSTDPAAIRLRAVRTLRSPADSAEFSALCQEVLDAEGIAVADLSMLLSGRSGDRTADRKLKQVEEDLFADTPKRYFKNLCGEYHTASAFGVWYAVELLRQVDAPAGPVLLINQYNDTNYSLILLSR